MADLDNILIFVKVAQYESISRAARSLGMPISTVSRRLSVLESQLGVTLLAHDAASEPDRTGTRILQRMPGATEPAAGRRTGLTQAREPEGMLRIGTVMLGQRPFLEFLSGFLKAHPRIRIDLSITNAFLDLVRKIDVAIRFGELRDSSVVGPHRQELRYLVAAPEYLKNRERPAEPGDLERHACVMLNARNNEAHWELAAAGENPGACPGPLSSRDFNTVSTFVYRGHGIGLLPSTYCDEAIARGRLVRLLPKGHPAHPRFCRLSQPEIPAATAECLPGGAGEVEQPAVGQGQVAKTRGQP